MDSEDKSALQYLSTEGFINPITASWEVKDPAAPVTTLEDQEQGLGKLSDLGTDVLRTMPVPVIQNIVCGVNLGCQLELKKIALSTRNSEYNPKRFAAVIMKVRNPRATALVFRSGKMICTGAKSEHDIYLAARKFARIIQKLGFNVRFFNFRIHNVVASVDSKFPVRLENIAKSRDTHNFATFEPEISAGLIFRMVKPKVVLLIFVSGKVIITGGKCKDDIYESYRNIFPLLWRNRKIN